MLRRLKNAKPRYKILIGLWLGFEIMSLPAAASVAFSLTGKTAPLEVDPVEVTEPGIAEFRVSHSVPFDIVVGGVEDDVTVVIEDAIWNEDVSSACVHLVGPAPRVAQTIDKPDTFNDSIASLYVTVSYEGEQAPDIRFEQVSFAPPALPCQNG